MKIRHQQTGETIEVPKGMENQMKQHISKGGDPMQLLGNKKKVKLNLKKHQQGGEQMQQQGGDQQAQMQQLVQMAAQALSQGADPQQVAQMLMQKGVPQEIVQQVIQAAMQDLQQQQGQQQAPQEQMPQEQEMQQQPQMNYGGYMQQGGLTDWWMQAGGQKKTTFADIEKMYQQIGKPAGASALTDYPPTYTYEPKPKVKIIPKKVYTPQTYQELPPSKIIDYPPTYTQTKENGGYMAEGGKHWIQGAVNPAHKGYCTPMTKATCTPKRKAFAKTMKKHHGFHQEGGFVKGQQYEMDDNQIAHLKSLGYKIKEV